MSDFDSYGESLEEGKEEDQSEIDPDGHLNFVNYIPSIHLRGPNPKPLINENSILNGVHHLFAPA
jgi:hypothetical protein